MGNLINRDAVIKVTRENTSFSHINFNPIIDIINSLPSIQPETVHMLKRESMKDELNCPNCGAPITSTECPYCGSVFGI